MADKITIAELAELLKAKRAEQNAKKEEYEDEKYKMGETKRLKDLERRRVNKQIQELVDVGQRRMLAVVMREIAQVVDDVANSFGALL